MNWENNAEAFERDIVRTAEAINAADAVFVDAGAGLSTVAGFTYSGERFERHFADFRALRVHRYVLGRVLSVCHQRGAVGVLEPLRYGEPLRPGRELTVRAAAQAA